MTALGQAHVIRGDARALPLPDSSVDLIVSSPPYFALRDYQDGGESYDGQIGSEPSPAEFVDALIAVTRECVRVLKPTGSLWINLGDKYNSGGGHTSAGATSQRQGRKSADDWVGCGGKTLADMPVKSLMGLPWRYAIRCVDELGLILRAEVVWDKPNGMPESVVDRVRRSHEQWFHFTREERYFSALDEIREPHLEASVKRIAAGYNPTKRDLAVTAGHNGPLSTRGDGGWVEGYTPNPLGKLPGSVWRIPSEPLKIPEHVAHAQCCGGKAEPGCEDGIDHFAAFPSEWPGRIIRGWAPLTGICTACGEGRRPASEAAYDAQGRTTNGPKNEARKALGQGADRAAMVRSGVRKVRSTTITGYVCGCNDPIRTPTGKARPGSGPTGSRPTGDPSKVVGRAGMARDRADGAGTRVVSRWEQRHVAGQLRVSPHRAAMEAEVGPAFAHYIRTDRSGARPLPEDVRLDWQAKGWITPAPVFEPPPTVPAVVLDPFGGTGTVAMVAKALGMVGVTVDRSADYCRIAEWRTNDRDQLAKVLDIAKPTGTAAAEALAGHDDLFSLMEEA